MAAMHAPHWERRCPWCGSGETRFVQRGYTGPTDEVDQYFSCHDCGKVTYELVAKSAREMRLGRFRQGSTYRDKAQQTSYQVSRVLKVGLNEYLLYLKPVVEPQLSTASADSTRI